MSGHIVFVDSPLTDSELARRIAPSGFELSLVQGGGPEYEAALPTAEYLVGFVAALVRDELYRAAPRLKLVQVLSAGYDAADLDAARAAGVPLANNGGANSVAVSEHAILLMLAASRQLVRQHDDVRSGRWRGNASPDLHEVREKRLGIIGFSNIGKKTARLAQAFGMRVVYHDIRRLTEAEEDALDVRYRLLKELLMESDVVSLHVALNESTRGLIGAGELALMKPSAILVNTSRGPVVDEAALIEALRERRIWGAGLDVYEQEPPAPDNPLFALDNVTLSAHLAGPTQESNIARLRNAFDNVARVERGEAPLWIVPELAG